MLGCGERPRADVVTPARWGAVSQPVLPAASEVVGALHSWDVSTSVDGPGTRFVAFLAGCPLRCTYCHNPDTWTRRGATPMTASALVAKTAGYRRFIEVAGGGVTLSGGEPLTQTRFVEAVLEGCKQLGLHTALDTAGAGGDRAPDRLLDLADLVLLDIKTWGAERYKALTGGDFDELLRFACRLADRGQRLWLRFVVVAGLTDRDEVVEGVARFAASLGCVERVDVLGMHRLAEAKYEALGRALPLGPEAVPAAATIEQVRQRFAAYGLDAI